MSITLSSRKISADQEDIVFLLDRFVFGSGRDYFIYSGAAKKNLGQNTVIDVKQVSRLLIEWVTINSRGSSNPIYKPWLSLHIDYSKKVITLQMPSSFILCESVVLAILIFLTYVCISSICQGEGGAFVLLLGIVIIAGLSVLAKAMLYVLTILKMVKMIGNNDIRHGVEVKNQIKLSGMKKDIPGMINFIDRNTMKLSLAGIKFGSVVVSQICILTTFTFLFFSMGFYESFVSALKGLLPQSFIILIVLSLMPLSFAHSLIRYSRNRILSIDNGQIKIKKLFGSYEIDISDIDHAILEEGKKSHKINLCMKDGKEISLLQHLPIAPADYVANWLELKTGLKVIVKE